MIAGKRADRRRIGRAKNVLSPKEAANIHAKLLELERVAEDGTAYLLNVEAEILAGSLWRQKLASYCEQMEDDRLILSFSKIHRYAIHPMTASRMVTLLIMHFKGARKAQDYMQGRRKRSELPQTIPIPLATVEKMIGIYWQERFRGAGIPYHTEIKNDNEMLYFSLPKTEALVNEALYAQVLLETTGRDRRSPYNQ